jgi:hypothetical protein
VPLLSACARMACASGSMSGSFELATTFRRRSRKGSNTRPCWALCMSANAFRPEWAQLEAGMFRFRDPLNKERRFVPLRLDDAPIKVSLAQFQYVNWMAEDREEAYARLLGACRPPAKEPAGQAPTAGGGLAERAVRLASNAAIWGAFSPDGRCVVSGGMSATFRLWDVDTGRLLSAFVGHTRDVNSVAWIPDQRFILSGSSDTNVQLWDRETQGCVHVMQGHTQEVASVA